MRPSPPLSLRLAPLVVAFLVAGCGSTSPSAPGAFRAELGRAPSAQVLAGVAADVLRLYGYELELVEADRVQAGWRYLSSGQRDQVTVLVRPRANDLYNGTVRIVVEEQGPGGSWQPAEPDAELRQEYGRFRTDVRTRLQRFMTQN